MAEQGTAIANARSAARCLTFVVTAHTQYGLRSRTEGAGIQYHLLHTVFLKTNVAEQSVLEPMVVEQFVFVPMVVEQKTIGS